MLAKGTMSPSPQDLRQNSDDSKPPGFTFSGSSRAPSGRIAHRKPSNRCWRCGDLSTEDVHPIPCLRCGNNQASPSLQGHPPGFFAGLLSPWNGFRFILSNPSLIPWILIPLFLNACLLVVLISAGISVAEDLSPQWTEAWPSWIDWIRPSLQWLLPRILMVISILAALLLATCLFGIINAPFYDLLASKTELIVFGPRPDEGSAQGLVREMLRSIWIGLHLAFRQATVIGFLFLLSFFAVGLPFLFFAGVYFAGLGTIDFVLAFKNYSGDQRMAWGRRRWDFTLGLGAMIYVIPPLQPLGVVGATLAYLDHPDKG